MSSLEYTWYVDSHNSERKLGTDEKDFNPTNDVYIPMNFARARLPVAQITLGSVELPLAQYTIENNWKNLYFDEGLDLIVSSPQDISVTQFIIEEDGTEVVGQLPPQLNPIVDVTPNPSTNPIFTTLYPHMLDLRGEYTWGDVMELISTPILDTDFTQLSSSNPNLVIISDTVFQINNLPAPVAFVPVAGIFGYVRAPTIPSPVYLSQLVTAALNLEVPNHWRLTYDPTEGTFKLKWIGSGCDAREVSPAFVMIPSNNSLAAIMGFGRVNVPIPLPSPEAKAPASDFDLIRSREVPDIKELCLISSQCFTCKSKICVDPGNYNPNELGANLMRQFNRFYFDPGCFDPLNPMVPPPINFVYSDECGACRTVVVPYGLYTPDTLAEYIESQIFPVIPSISIRWNNVTGQFCFDAEEMFGLEFDVSNPDLAMRLGFLPLCYRNSTSYKSPKPFYVPVKGCCASTIPDRFLSYNYNILLIGTQRKYDIEVCKTRCLNAVTAVDNGDGTMTLTTMYGNPAAPIAHGYQPHDVVDITVAATGDTYPLMVTEVNAYNQFTVELGSIPFATFAGTLCTCLHGSIVGNLYFAPDCQQENPIMPFILGFLNEDFLWQPNQTGFTSPSCFNLDWPSYLLIEIIDPNGATRNNHNWEGDNKPRIFGKIVLYPQYRMERMFPIQMYLPDLRTINRMKFRFLNPDHTLYQLHGRDWSMTLVFVVLEKQIQQLCY